MILVLEWREALDMTWNGLKAQFYNNMLRDI